MVFMYLFLLISLFVDAKKFSISGFSSGAFMASQMHVAFSKDVVGAGIIGGGPYFCAMNHPLYAKYACTTTPSLISIDALKTYANLQSKLGKIDDISNLKTSKVWIFGGTNDTMINVGVGKKVKDFYKGFIPEENIVSYFDIPAAHGFITDDYGKECGIYGFPYINNCNVDAAGGILSLIYGKLNPKGNSLLENLVEFDQTVYLKPSAGIASVGYKYVPNGCKENDCTVHVALHGCGMSFEYIGDAFITHAGYNDWAESNNIIIVYPQAERHTPYNAHACWDAWGVSGADYALKTGLQMSAIYQMAQSS